MLDALSRRASLFARRLRKLFGDPRDPACAARLQEEQFDALRRNTPGMMAANIGNALALLATFIETPLAGRVAIWTDALIFVCIYIYLRARRGRARRRKSAGRPTSIGKRAAINAAVLGGLWAAVPPLFFLDAGPGARLMVTSLTAGMLFGGAFALARAPIAATVFSAPIAVSGAATLIAARDPDLSRIAFVLFIYTAVLLRNVYVEAAAFRDRILSQMGAERQARTDPLTGLPNRLAFTDVIERELARAARYGGGFMLLLVDIDDFKMVNDRYGHPAGDELLSQAAQRMRNSLRAVDFVARLGGDEFAIIATDVANDDSARAVARRIAACFEEPFKLEGRVVQGEASVGGALAPRDGDNQKALFKSADVALYEAKAQGEWRLFTRRDQDDRAVAPLSEEQLRLAFSRGDLSLAYQPVLNLASDEIAGFEALLRWRCPTRGEIPPVDFIPLAEKSGLIHEIGLWTIESACAAATRFAERFRVCVNVSPVQFERPDFAERLLDALARAGLAANRLEIEIAERAMLCDLRLFEEQLRKVSEAGVAIALDDFAAGYAALAQFCKSPLDQVKIDGPLAREAVTRKECAAVVAGVTQMAKSFHMTVVAEGVETREQLEWLRQAGVDEAQGFLIAAPMPLDRLEAFVAGWSPARRPAVAALSV
ncbi:putative bifunctional diguanylate cyclase/phosphodiesterase [Methylocystis sp. JAN1]|uniref:putative bifunctional diguanylate cyclase/phosphodiesterase n=1 Tax=Methylocystis sp. JAN1 TaxID=3397211 RepID=UPI003FA1DF64